MDTKTCARCKKEYPKTKEFFSVSEYLPDGRIRFSSRCKPCLAELKREKRRNNPDHFKTIEHKRYERNKDKRNARARQYHWANRDELNQKARDRRLTRGHVYNANRMTKYYQMPNPEQRKAAFAGHRARKVAAPGKHTNADIKRQLTLQHGRCFWCSNVLDVYHIDHIIPLSRGGSNWPANIVIACPFCNISKKDRLPFTEWTPPRPLLRF